jgi:hypothetical protein
MMGAGTTAITCMITKIIFLGFDIRKEAKEEAKANLAKAAEELLPSERERELDPLREKKLSIKYFEKNYFHPLSLFVSMRS